MDTNKMREQFEEWFIREFYEGDRSVGLEWLSTEPCGGYRYSQPAQAWRIWQASREAVVELPSLRKIIMGRRENEYDSGVNHGIELCREAIEAQGLKVTP